METIDINLNKDSSDIRISPPIKLESKKKHEMVMIRLETYNSIPNVNETNNLLICEVIDAILNI